MAKLEPKTKALIRKTPSWNPVKNPDEQKTQGDRNPNFYVASNEQHVSPHFPRKMLDLIRTSFAIICW
jgi:hypothetical protein